MDALVLHPHTKQLLQRFVSHPTHALALLGPPGAGKLAIALALTRRLLALPADKIVTEYPYLRLIAPEPDKRSIGIEAVRELLQFTALKMPGKDNKLRVIIIPDAHQLTTEAQNALLKLLEEPPADTHFILTANDEQGLLPTIRSRTQIEAIHQPPKADLEAFFIAQGIDAKAIQQAYFMSGGLPGLMNAILSQEEHPLKHAAQTARQLLQGSQFERLCKVDELSKSRTDALHVLVILRHMAQAAIAQTAATELDATAAAKRIKQWHKVLQASYDAEQAYAVSAQAKLTLTNLMLSL